ncbi:IPT/TIG domain-containing protein, partial [bacterium]|nr:IPT/TIG domain-containing protein [bacterium]
MKDSFRQLTIKECSVFGWVYGGWWGSIMRFRYWMIVAILSFCSFNVLVQDVDLELLMPSYTFAPGMEFELFLDLLNTGEGYSDAQLFIALNVGTDDYWFYPSWAKYPDEADWEDIYLPHGFGKRNIIISGFSWPGNLGSFYDASFIAAVVAGGELVSNIDVYNFGYVEKPTILEISPQSGAPGLFLAIQGLGFDFDAESIQVVIGKYEFDAVTMSDAAGIRSVTG